jgi:hypothetical protein
MMAVGGARWSGNKTESHDEKNERQPVATNREASAPRSEMIVAKGDWNQLMELTRYRVETKTRASAILALAGVALS